jgi:EAL domain-containing protein (putative c-di-GMP-specific phosphodiesterase class I)
MASGQPRGTCGLRLGSLFQPIVDLRHQRVVGHQAILHARREDGTAVSPAEAYARCETPASVVHVDRLCHTLHALNFLAQQHTGGYLQLSVHPRHLLAVQTSTGWFMRPS